MNNNTLLGGDCQFCGKYFSNSLKLYNHEIECFQKFTKRHTCIICNRKRYERYMKKVLVSSWVCTDEYHFQFCSDNEEIKIATHIQLELKKLKHIKIQHILGK